MDYPDIIRPTLLLRPEIAKRNIRRMADKAEKAGVEFRPHFKSHQSLTIGHWFQQAGVKKITVSSLNMAAYFASAGWEDITIAVPVNIREIPRISKLAARVKLNIIVDSPRTVTIIGLNDELENPVHVWVEADCGDNRTGIPMKKKGDFVHMIQTIDRTPNMEFAGIITHAGHSYKYMKVPDAQAMYADIQAQISELKAHFSTWSELKDRTIKFSFGDTPLCTLLDEFPEVDEIRPGNFVFYDIMQHTFGVCDINDIAVAMACPVISTPSPRKFTVHGGSVHFSKEFLPTDLKRRLVSEGKNFGWQVSPTEKGWHPYKNNHLYRLSQEHGEVYSASSNFGDKTEGEIAFFLPIHSCVTADLMMRYYIWEDGNLGEEITMMKTEPGYANGFFPLDAKDNPY